MPPRLARFAWVAAAFHGKRWKPFPEWTAEQLGVELRVADVDRHVKSVRAPTNKGRKPAKPQAGVFAVPARSRVIEDWVKVEEEKLGLLKVLFRIPGDYQRRGMMHQELNKMVGIRSYMEVGADLELLAVGLVRTMPEADELRATIQRLVPRDTVRMETVSAESHSGSPVTWVDIAKRELAEVLESS